MSDKKVCDQCGEAIGTRWFDVYGMSYRNLSVELTFQPLYHGTTEKLDFCDFRCASEYFTKRYQRQLDWEEAKNVAKKLLKGG